MTRALSLALLLLVGCSVQPLTADEAATAADLQRWEARNGYAPLCDAQFALLQFDEVSESELQQQCDADFFVEGCFTHDRVLLLAGLDSDERELIRLHEVTHWLLQCSGRAGTDREHTNEAWRELRKLSGCDPVPDDEPLPADDCL